MVNRLAKVVVSAFGHLPRSAAAMPASFLTLAILASSASAWSTTSYLNSYSPTDAPSNSFCTGAAMMTSTPLGCGDSIVMPAVLASGTTYTATVTGAVSAWGAWPFSRCGKPELSSQFASPGVANRPAGDDAQFRFAVPRYAVKCRFKREKTPFFQVNLGSGWFHPVASNDPSKPSGDHKSPTEQHPYTFTLAGQGVDPQFRFVDYHPSDNSGQFKIVVIG